MLDTFDLCFLSFYFFLPHTQCSLYLNIPMQTVQLHHTMFPIPTQRLSSQRISCAPQGFPSPHVWDFLEYHRDPLCELGLRTSSSSYVLLDPSWRPQLPRQVCGEQHTPLCSHQGEKRDKNGGINETGLGWGRQMFRRTGVWITHTEHLNRWVFETSEVCSCGFSRSAVSPCSGSLVFCCILPFSLVLTLSSCLALNSSVWFSAGQPHCEINSRL